MFSILLFSQAHSFLSQIFGAVNVQTPSYDLLQKTHRYEVRLYHEQIRATAHYEGHVVSGEAFSTIADYIFGDNSEKVKIDMTAPVINKALGESKKGNLMTVEQCQMQFIMPSKFKTIQDLPKPVRSDVVLVEVPAKKLIVRQVSGDITEREFNKVKEQLKKDAEAAGLKVVEDSAILMRYNPPWTVPFMRTNEVAWELQ